MKHSESSLPRPRIAGHFILENHITHVAAFNKRSILTSTLAKAHLINPKANLARTLATLTDLGGFLALSYPGICDGDFRPLSIIESLQEWYEQMPPFGDWSLTSQVTHHTSAIEKTVHECTLKSIHFTTETNMLIAHAKQHQHAVAEHLILAARLGSLAVKNRECTLIYGSLRDRIKALDLDSLFF